MAILNLALMLAVVVAILSPSFFFLRRVSRQKATVEVIAADQQAAHLRKALLQLAACVGLLVLLLLFSPWIKGFDTSPAKWNMFGIQENFGLFALRIAAFAALLFCALAGIRNLRRVDKANYTASFLLLALAGHFMVLSYLAAGFFHLLGGLAWGRPLRVAGKIVKPELKAGNAWAKGDLPDAASLDEATRRALEALWLHDAVKEYASVPAFSRLGWQMAAFAAPPELLRDIHIAALQEIEHARKCFALAAGFGDAAQTVRPMPELLGHLSEPSRDTPPTLATESLLDGCLLEGFNADVAERSIGICTDDASLAVIRQIAREERSHAELSWRVLEFCLTLDPAAVRARLKKEIETLFRMPRPTAVSMQNMPLIAAASSAALIAFGRLPDNEFDPIWQERVRNTGERLRALLDTCATANGAAPFSIPHHRRPLATEVIRIGRQ